VAIVFAVKNLPRGVSGDQASAWDPAEHPRYPLHSSTQATPAESRLRKQWPSLSGEVGSFARGLHLIAAWRKAECLNRQEFVVVGWTDPKGSRPHLSGLLLGYFGDDGKRVYAGRFGAGMSEKAPRDLRRRRCGDPDWRRESRKLQLGLRLRSQPATCGALRL
jgi:hypothetical protein